jgi:nucleotide-binding universal stress UspA family protein
MTYRAILVHVPLGNAEMQIELAASLAKESGAHLTGICSLVEVALLKDAMRNPFLRLDPARVEELVKGQYDRAGEAKKRFDAIATRAGVAHSWTTGEGDAADLIIHACRLQDLAVVEQCGDPSDLLWGPAVQLALSGHPALIVPRAWQTPQFGRRALVAWNGSAQSAAAVRKALPLLRRAERVTVLLGHSRASFPAAMRPPELDIVAYLKHEGVSAAAENLAVSDADAGAAILKSAADSGADLIVMGAFGRSRFREWVLGGATRHVLQHMTVPVFMAHQ